MRAIKIIINVYTLKHPYLW